MERMTGLDATFLYLETPEQPMVINAIIELDVSEVPGGYTFEALRVELQRRLKEVPQFRRKMSDSPLNLGHPAWVEEYDLDIDRHLHRVDLPAGGDRAHLSDLCGELASHPLDRSRPLWEAWVIEGLPEPDHLAVFCRVHHSVFDGVSATQVIGVLTGDGTAERSRDVGLVRRQAGPEAPLRLVAGGVAAAVRRPLAILRLLPGTLAVPLVFARGALGRRGGGEDSGGRGQAAPFSAPRTRFNGTLTPRRTMSYLSLDLDELREIKDAYETTLNDVLLTVVGGGLRTMLDADGELPAAPLVGLVPVSTHADGDDAGAGSGNQISVMFSTLGTDIADPVDRLSEIARRGDRGKSSSGSLDPDLLENWTALAPAWLLEAGVRAYGALGLAERHPVLYNLIVSNVPGPPGPLYFLGARILHMYPMGPLFHGAGLSVTGVSSDGRLDLGIIACEHLLPNPSVVADGIAEATRQLLAAARA